MTVASASPHNSPARVPYTQAELATGTHWLETESETTQRSPRPLFPPATLIVGALSPETFASLIQLLTAFPGLRCQLC